MATGASVGSRPPPLASLAGKTGLGALPSPQLRTPCGSAFLRRLHSDPNASHISLSAPPPSSVEGPFAGPSQSKPLSASAGIFETSLAAAHNLEEIFAEPESNDAAISLQQYNQFDGHGTSPRSTVTPLPPKMRPWPSRLSPSCELLPEPVRQSSFQERVDRSSLSTETGDRASSFAASSTPPPDLHLQPGGDRQSSWNEFAAAYCCGRFDPVRIPYPPDFQEQAAARAAPPPSAAPYRNIDDSPSFQSEPIPSLSSPPDGWNATVPLSCGLGSEIAPAGGSMAASSSLAGRRQGARELESIPKSRAAKPTKLTLPGYAVAAATVRLASSNLQSSMFAPLSVPSPERELLDPMASMVMPGPKNSNDMGPGIALNRSMSSMLPVGTPPHETLPAIQGSPTGTPGAERSWAGDGDATAANDSSKSGNLSSLKSVLPASAPTKPKKRDPAIDDYFGGLVPKGADIDEPPLPVPVPGVHAYPLVHHPHELEAFYRNYGFLPAPMPPKEAERRKALYSFNILHTGGDLNFDRIVHMTKLVFNTRMVFLSLIDSDQQWYKSQTGFGGSMSPRMTGFCGHCLLVESDEPFVILDTQLDWRFARNPHVIGEPNIRFYAGAPLRTAEGHNLGSLCLVDDQPRTEFTPRSRHILKEFAAIVMRELELWRDKLQLRTRDKIQTSMERFTRECLEIDEKLSSTNFEAASRMSQVYQRAAKLVHTTLDLDGCAILDISQFERVEVPLPGGGQSIVYHANPYHETQSVFERVQNFGTVNAFPVLASTPNDVTTRPLTPLEHERMAAFLGDQRDGRIFENVAPSWIKYIFPSTLKYGMVVPVIGIDGQPFALICAHTHDRGKQFLEGYELQFLRAIGVIILSAVLRRRMLIADRSKSVLISSVSHELRTPLHGILAATELLNDSPLDTNQAAFLSTVKTCGMQLIETVNHVLDFTKLNSEAKSNGSRRPPHMTEVNLAELIEQTVESCYVGQRARWMQNGDNDLGSYYAPAQKASPNPGGGQNPNGTQMKIEAIVDIGLRPQGWNVSCENGSVRRVIMNLFGNSLKFTEDGFVQVVLRELPHDPHAKKIPVELTVIDTGKGIGKTFLKDQLFEPFTQENPLQPGTGLGLAIVNTIVRSDAVHGSVDVWSAEGVGTEIRVSFEVEVRPDPETAPTVPEFHAAQGLKVAFLGFDIGHRGVSLVREVLQSYVNFMGFEVVTSGDDADLVIVHDVVTKHMERFYTNKALILVAALRKSDPAVLASMGRGAYTGIVYKPIGATGVLKELMAAIKWLKNPTKANSGLSTLNAKMLTVSLDDANGDQLGEFPRIGSVESPADSLDSVQNTNTESQYTWPLPVHTRAGEGQAESKLHRRRSDERDLNQVPTRPAMAPRGLTYHSVPRPPLPTIEKPGDTSPGSASGSFSSPSSTISLADGGAILKAAALPEVDGQHRRPAHVMIVEDNAINRRVLTAFLKKHGFEHMEAVNGAAGVELFNSTPMNYWDVILMDITMPVMNGYDATRSIRRIESARRLTVESSKASLGLLAGHAKIFALTGLATADDKRQAFDSGVDGFLVKPVSLASLDLLFKKIGF